jgi:hypothetical protein
MSTDEVADLEVDPRQREVGPRIAVIATTRRHGGKARRPGFAPRQADGLGDPVASTSALRGPGARARELRRAAGASAAVCEAAQDTAVGRPQSAARASP